MIFSMSNRAILFYIIIFLNILSCGKKGEPQPNEKKKNNPTSSKGPQDEGGNRGSIGTTIDLTTGKELPALACQQQRNSEIAETASEDPIMMDGIIDFNGGTEITSENLAGLLSARVFKKGHGLYLFLKVNGLSDVRLIFNSARYFEKTLYLADQVELSWSKTNQIQLRSKGETKNLTENSSPSRAKSFNFDGESRILELDLAAEDVGEITKDQVFG